MIRLFIENKEVELDKNVSFAINKQFEDITSPADIKNDWSKTVEIPFTQSNNKLFGELFNVDRLIVEGDTTLMGIYFDPYKKVNFRLQWGSSIIMRGYVKILDIVKAANGTGHYNITLNGELGKVFQEMKKITFDTATEDTKYLIDGGKYVDEVINKDLINTLWSNEPDLDTLDLVEKTDSKYRIQDYIGFVPNNSYNDDFDYKTFQKQNENTSMKFEEVLDEKAKTVADDENATYQSVVGIAADTVIGDGLLPREIGEYRSYMQLPYIYFNKLFNIFARKTTEITGYSVETDGAWFSNQNPYWNRYVCMLKQFNTNVDVKGYNGKWSTSTLGYFVSKDDANHTYLPRISDAQPITWNPFMPTGFLDEVRADFIAGKFDNITISQDIPVKLLLTDTQFTDDTIAWRNYVIFDSGYMLNIQFRVKDENGNVVFTSIPTCLHNPNNKAFEGNGVTINGIPKVSEGNYEISFNMPFGISIDRNIVGNDFSVEVAVYSSDVYDRGIDTIFSQIDSLEGGDAERVFPDVLHVIALPTNVTINTSNRKRSNSRFILNDLWNNEFNVFDVILNYCKQFRIGVFCDDIYKRLIFKPLSTYFNDYKVLDWTHKLDTSREYHIQPITFQNKYVLFNYEKYDTELNNLYNEKYGRNFCEYRLTTDYEFNTDEKKLFKNSKVAIPSTELCLSWENLYDMSVVYTVPAEVTVNNKDEDKKNVSIFGAMMFYKGLSDFDITSGLRSVKVTDDTDFQTFNQTYFYTQDGQQGTKVNVSKYPVLDIVTDDNLCTFATPSENYTYKPKVYDNTNGIYYNFWEKYLNERYNKQNKIVTCYLRLTPTDIANFEYNHFVKIGSQLYMINKIYDYQIDENQTTKVDLVTIQDIKGYTENNFKLFTVYNDEYEKWNYYRDYITLTEVGMEKTIYITSNTPVKWTDESAALQSLLVYYNNDMSTATNAKGVIPAGELVPVTFLMNEEYDEFGDVIFTNGTDEVRVSVALTIDSTFTVYDSDRTAWTSTDKVELENTTPLTKTIYISSPNSQVDWEVSSNLQGMGVCVDGDINDWGEYEFDRGFIPSGSMIPVTFRMSAEGDVNTINGTVKLSTERQETIINVRLIYNEIFNVYRWDGELWDSTNDYILLDSSTPSKTLYLTANSDVQWSDETNELQNLYINAGGDYEDWGEYTNGSGTIKAPSNMKPIYFRLDVQGMETGSTGNIVFFNGRHDWIIPVRLA